MTQTMPEQAEARVRFGDAPTMTLSGDLAEAVLREVWKASPERFGNFVKKAMIRLYSGQAPSANGHRP